MCPLHAFSLRKGNLQTFTGMDGATQLVNLLKQGNYETLLTNLASLLGGGTATQGVLSSGREILRTLFGAKLSAVIDWLASGP
jgi:hypothetical protein